MKYFYYTERNNGDENWNLLDYSSGPADIKILGYEKIIVVTIREKWSYMFDDLKLTCLDAWKVQNDKIEILSKTSFQIQYDIKIVQNYLDYTIVFF